MSISKKKIRNEYMVKLTEILEWLCVLLLVLLSGCVFFTQAHRIETSLALVICTVLYSWKKKARIEKSIIMVWIFIVSMLFVSFVANSSSMTIGNIADYGLIFVVASCLSFISTGMSLQSFQAKYIKIMCVICLVSLACYYIQMTDYGLVLQIGNTSVVSGYIVSWYHTWGWSYVFARNAGPFWEPGAFQGFLFLAILFILNTRKIEEHCIALIVLIIGVMTTFSTTGYALLAIISVYLLFVYWQTSVKGARITILALISIIAITAIVIFLVWYVIDSGVISNKLTYRNESFNIRMLHLKKGGEVIMQRPVFGYGVSSPSLLKAIGQLGMDSNSVGIFSILQYFGLFFGITYIIANFYATCKVYRNLNVILVLIIFAILHLTESLFLFPIYMSFLFLCIQNPKRLKNENIMDM